MTTIVTMGYSFPSGDTQTAALVGSAVRARKGQQIIVVDLNRQVVRRVAEVAMPPTGLVRYFGGMDQPIASWSEDWSRDPEETLG